ncbi:MAG: glutamine-hydrolyzing GMP synthase [Treponemataceae bacterium]
MNKEKILVLDFGSQYAHLIAKSFRSLGFYTEIALPSVDTNTLKKVKGIVLSGGPASIYEKNRPLFNEALLDLGIPVLGLCYGHQLIAAVSGGTVQKATVGEFGIAQLEKKSCDSPLFEKIDFPMQVWMSHQDEVTSLSEGFEAIGFTKDCAFAAVQNREKQHFSLQFHVEVKDTPQGNIIFENFARLCNMQKNWDHHQVLEVIEADIKNSAKDKNVLLFLSGGVDSSVAFALLNKTLGCKRVLGLHIDNGFMRKNESFSIAQKYKDFGFDNFIVEDASSQFLHALDKKTDPQEKRHIIGETFISVRDEVVSRLQLNEDDWLLAQGTLYPDIIESGGSKNAHVIKTHHNRVKGIQRLIEKGLIIEPLKDLYKDEVRLLGRDLGLSDELIDRHPFPGPGLAINVLCCNKHLENEENSTEYQSAKKEILHFIQTENQQFAHIKNQLHNMHVLPVKSVGVQGDFRTYCHPAVLYFAQSDKNQVANLPSWIDLENFSSHITNGVKLINRCVVSLYEKKMCCLQQGFCTKERLDQTREVDAIVLDILRKSGLYHKIFQHLTINIPYATNENHCSIVLRPVVSQDVMTARFAPLDKIILQTIVDQIQKLNFVDALYYDISNKPPATFGWE